MERKREIAPDDEVGIVSYSHSATVLSEPLSIGSSIGQLSTALDQLSVGNATSISAGLTAAQDLLFPRGTWWDKLVDVAVAPGPERIRRIVLLTDGHHNSGSSPKSVGRTLKAAHVCIDCVGIGGDPSAVDEPLLKKIASTFADGKTPRYAFIGDKDSLITKFEDLAGRITR